MSRRSAPAPTGAMGPPQIPRQNEYFLPRDGIDREVIQADICRYLGNDALVRPGTYENPQTGQTSHGYYITAYRNLTSAMIDDLKADSARWEQERRMQQSRNSAGGQYRTSDTYARRQMAGPSGGGYDDRDPYNASPRYPGSDAPGYSGHPSSSQGYGQAPQGQYGSGGAPFPPASTGTGGYSSAGYSTQAQYQDPRYQNQPMSMAYQAQPDTTPYIGVNANRVTSNTANAQPYSRNQYDAGGDVMMTSGAPTTSSYATTGASQGGYGQASYYAQPSTTGYGQQPLQQPMQQPHDPFAGRRGGAADPRTTSPGAGKSHPNYPGPSSGGHTSPSYPNQAQYEDREQPQSRSGHQGQSSSTSTRHKESRSHHSSSRHDKYR